MAELSHRVLVQHVREILKDADLEVMTPKLVRQQLRDRLMMDMEERKKEIGSIIHKILDEREANDALNNSKKKDTKNGDSNRYSPSKRKSDGNDDEDDGGSNSSSSDSLSDNDNNGVERVKSKSRTKLRRKSSKRSSSDSNNSDNNSDVDQIDRDAELARKLQEAERRPTRNSLKGIRFQSKPIRKEKKKGKKSADDEDEEKLSDKKSKKTGYMKPCQLSHTLGSCSFIGTFEMPRHEVVSRIWKHVKDNNLFDPRNRQYCICDDELEKVVGKKRFRLFGMMKYLSHHIDIAPNEIVEKDV